jgi:hypothetical protein
MMRRSVIRSNDGFVPYNFLDPVRGFHVPFMQFDRSCRIRQQAHTSHEPDPARDFSCLARASRPTPWLVVNRVLLAIARIWDGLLRSGCYRL